MSGSIPQASIPDPVAQKRKQMFLLVLGTVGILGVLGALIALQKKDGANAAQSAEVVKKKYSAAGQNLSNQEVWIAKSETQLQKMQTEKDAMQREVDSLRARLEREESKGSAAVPPPPLPPLASMPANRDALVVPPGRLPPPPAPLKNVQIEKEPSGLPTLSYQQASIPPAGQLVAPVPESPIYRIEIEAPSDNALPPNEKKTLAKGGKTARQAEEDKAYTSETYLPAGTFVRAVIIGGLDAPASGQAQSNPHPILLRLQDLAVLPNHFRTNIRECFVVGAGYGDISSERAYIRTETLSCVQTGGQVIEAKLNGYVAGEDGKTGVRGRLVTKQGQLLARALMSGIASGLGSALSQQYVTTSTSALGSTQTVDSGEALQYGVASGTSSALDRLSKYYIEMAEKTFPIIEIDAGREVEVVLTRGATLEGTPYSMTKTAKATR
jgi:conjugal transfer pilus assembly protein TraB